MTSHGLETRCGTPVPDVVLGVTYVSPVMGVSKGWAVNSATVIDETVKMIQMTAYIICITGECTTASVILGLSLIKFS